MEVGVDVLTLFCLTLCSSRVLEGLTAISCFIFLEPVMSPTVFLFLDKTRLLSLLATCTLVSLKDCYFGTLGYFMKDNSLACLECYCFQVLMLISAVQSCHIFRVSFLDVLKSLVRTEVGLRISRLI